MLAVDDGSTAAAELEPPDCAEVPAVLKLGDQINSAAKKTAISTGTTVPRM